MSSRRRRPGPAPRAPRLALFGGSFDPPHLGHLVMAEWARVALQLDRVLLMPAARPPHKRRPDLSPVAVRLGLLRAAVRGRPGLAVSSLEARRAGPSYTVDTLRALRRRHPRAELFLLIGEDSLRELGTWREPAAILGLATAVVARRPPGASRPAATRRAGARLSRLLRARPPLRLDNPGVAVSSSLVRARVRAGLPVRFLVPDAVEAAIRRRGLYGVRRRGRS